MFNFGSIINNKMNTCELTTQFVNQSIIIIVDAVTV